MTSHFNIKLEGVEFLVIYKIIVFKLHFFKQ